MLTSTGRGAIATVGVCGPASLAALDRLFTPVSGRRLAGYTVGSAVYGRFRSSDRASEDVVVGLFADIHAEIHCHGGPAAVAAIGEALVREGGIELQPEDWLHRQIDDKIAAEALIALAAARTERSAAILMDQFRGALSRELAVIDRLLVQDQKDAAGKKIGGLLARADLGIHLTQPWKVVFTGRPNVGKSSLMNAILGYERSIVWHQPGTTRDVLTATTAIDGWWIELSDVAGLRTSGDVLETAGVTRAQQEIAAADLVILVVDLTAAWDTELYDYVCQRLTASGILRPPIIVHNKCDLPELPSANRRAGIRTSAITGSGLPDLCKAISKTLVPSPPDPGAAIPFAPQHLHQLRPAAAPLTPDL